ncbi:plasmid stabilization protein [Rhizobium sp. SGZ-381]|uniref:FitA-like ribbon-helix-helix domain-containing protein n=1 Tax=Rhizobium sp. SGZ-381 TaxID=3342800 RepID=UPI00366FAB02
MGDLLIRNIPDAIRQSLAERAERSGRSVSEEVAAILGEELGGLGRPREADARSRLLSLRKILKADNQDEADLYAEIMEGIEAKRKSDFGRLPDDAE